MKADAELVLNAEVLRSVDEYGRDLDWIQIEIETLEAAQRLAAYAREQLAETADTGEQKLQQAIMSLLAVTVYNDNGYCSLCHGHWPNHTTGCQGKKLRDILEARPETADAGDDGMEMATPEWMAQQLRQKLETRRTVWLNSSVNIVSDTAWCGGDPLCSIEYKFQFRNLCKALGIELKGE